MGQETSHLTPEVAEDLVSQTKFSKDELQEWYQGFMKDYPSGRLTVEEFKKVYSSCFPNGDASKFAEHIFRTFDVNQDGAIDFRELVCALSVTSYGTVDQKLQWAFTMYDLDGNGYISREEMTSIVKAVYQMLGSLLPEENTPEKCTDTMFEKIDFNKDGRISLSEFVQGIKGDSSLLAVIDSLKVIPEKK